MVPRDESTESLGRDIERWAKELGFQQAGITGVNLGDQEPHVRRWLRQGFHGEMGYLARNVDKRLHPPLLEPETCTVISARMNYLPPGADPVATLDAPDQAYIARYALGRDYHKLMRRRLAKLAKRIDEAARRVDARFRAFTDSAPVLEKALGERAGLGWIGKNTLLIHPDAGSWFFIGEIYTNLPLPHTEAAEHDRCGSCKACIRVCPTGAIVGPKQLDARRCISYLTIEHKSSIPEDLRPLIGNRIFGCDDCQLFCPWNRDPETTGEKDFLPRRVTRWDETDAGDQPSDREPAKARRGRNNRSATGAGVGASSRDSTDRPDQPVSRDLNEASARLDQVSLLELFAWDEATFLANTRGSALRRLDYERWQRNLAVALGNGPATPVVIQALRERLPGASAMVREHLEWALRRLSASGYPASSLKKCSR